MAEGQTHILGINAGLHDAAATLVSDGVIRAHWSEERLSRVKHDGRYPHRAIAACLGAASLAPADIAEVAYAWNYWPYEAEKFSFYVEQASRIGAADAAAGRRWLADTRARKEVLYKTFAVADVETRRLFRRPPVHVDHHLAHAYQAIAMSGFEDAAILVVDGSGELKTVSIWDHHGEAPPRLVWHRDLPHSLGVFYGAITQFLGFRHHDEEWKVMGLSAYGQPSRIEAMGTLLDADSLSLNLEYFQHFNGRFPWYAPAMETLLGVPPAAGAAFESGEPPTAYADIAASAQAQIEIAMRRLAHRCRDITGRSRLAIAGGVALNGLAVGSVVRSGLFERVFVPPAAADDGTSIGAALAVAHRTGKPVHRRVERVDLGGAYSDDRIRQALSGKPIVCEPADGDALIQRTAQAIRSGKIVGWFQGRSEIGARALGFRSILADPSRPEMKDLINACIKFREPFRPFAPAVLSPLANRLVEGPVTDALFMNQILTVTPEGRRAAPATTHIDGTARVQVVKRENNPLFYDLIAAVGAGREIPVVLNTSFNRKGEPIVETPEEAIACFLETNLELLAIGSWIVTKAGCAEQ